MLVDGHTARLERFGGNLLLFIAHEVSHKWKEIDRSFLGTDIKDANLTVGDTTAVADSVGLTGNGVNLRHWVLVGKQYFANSNVKEGSP